MLFFLAFAAVGIFSLAFCKTTSSNKTQRVEVQHVDRKGLYPMVIKQDLGYKTLVTYYY